jgi:uncharacterized protein YjbI with pentapeptide repeats
MRVIKPLRLGVLTRPFEREQKSHLSIAILTFFPFDAPDRILPEVALWKLAAEVLGAEGVLDEVMPKPRAEVLLAGSAFPRNPPQRHTRARLQMGPVERTFYVFGDRQWGVTGPTEPVPFASMPLTWSRAFGGAGFARNPNGLGAAKVDGVQPLPNIESPDAMVKSPGDKPEPACPMALDVSWPQRVSKSGTYDDRWLKEQYPGFPLDFDWSFFQVAQEPQRFPGFLKGGEAFVLENLHPSEGTITSRLPVGRGRCFIVKQGHEGMIEVPTVIETVWLFPNQLRGAVIHRGVVPVAEDDAADVLQLMAAYELPDQPRPREHYEQVLAARLDPKKGLASLLRDRELLPELPPKTGHGDEALSDMDELLKLDNHAGQNAHRAAQREVDKARKQLEELAKDPKLQGVAMPPPPPDPPPLAKPPSFDDLGDAVEQSLDEAEAMIARADADKEKAFADARATCEAHGIDFDKALADARTQELKRKRRYRATEELERLRDQATLLDNAGADSSAIRDKLDDPTLVEKLVAMERAANLGYRYTAHLMPKTLAEPDEHTRVELEDGARARRSFAGRDLTNADLSDLDLTGVDLEGAFLEAANLRGAKLVRANLKGAILAHADLTDADLSGADLTDANLGKATIESATFKGAKLDKATLASTTIKGSNLASATLSSMQLIETTFEDVDLSGAILRDLMIYKSTFSRTKLVEAQLGGTMFVECTLTEVDGRRAKMVDKVAFVESKAERVSFEGADLKNVRVVKDSDFTAASFARANLTGANFRGTALREADFTGAMLDSADMSEADLTRAKLDRIHANDALFIRTTLEHASLREAVMVSALLQKAKVAGADFRGANLFRMDALGMRGDDKTSFEGAFVKRVRFTPEGRRRG